MTNADMPLQEVKCDTIALESSDENLNDEPEEEIRFGCIQNSHSRGVLNFLVAGILVTGILLSPAIYFLNTSTDYLPNISMNDYDSLVQSHQLDFIHQSVRWYF